MINQSFTCCTLGKLSLGEFSLRKGKFWRPEQTKLARIIGLGNVHAQISLEIAHVSLFAGYGESGGCNEHQTFFVDTTRGVFLGDGETIVG